MKPSQRARLIVCWGVVLAACGPPPSPLTLTVTKVGTGSGKVVGSPAGIDCGADCEHAFASGTAVTLTATADPGSVFTGWSGGGCSGNGTCRTVVTKSGSSVTATFDRMQYVGPFVVKQTVTLGHETISGTVCDITKPFTVPAVAPNVSWNFNFIPADASKGTWTYAYTIQSAGESHDASGTYTIGLPAMDGTLTLTMKGSDHVVFTGFNGNLPVSYQFNLVPTNPAACP